jgi:hypothetical protein
MRFSAPSIPDATLIPFFAASDPVGGLDHSLPIHPDEGRSKPFDYWEEQLHKRKPGKRKPQIPPEKPHDPSHQINDYA